MKLGKVEDARSAVAQLDQVSAEDFRMQAGIGVLLARYRLYDDAIRHFASALQVQPYYASTHFGLADARVGKKEFPLAIEHYKVALRTDPVELSDASTKEELYEEAQRLGIQGRSDMSKDELAAEITARK